MYKLNINNKYSVWQYTQSLAKIVGYKNSLMVWDYSTVMGFVNKWGQDGIEFVDVDVIKSKMLRSMYG